MRIEARWFHLIIVVNQSPLWSHQLENCGQLRTI